MKGYVPEGSYFLIREMFENETDENPTIWHNWNAVDCTLVDHFNSNVTTRTNLYNKYYNMRIDHLGEAIHNSSIQTNDFITEVVAVMMIPDADITDGAEWRILIRDSNGNDIAGMGLRQVGNLVKAIFIGGESLNWTAVADTDFVNPNEWQEVKCYIHNSNSNYPNRVEFLCNGYRYWYDNVANEYIRDKTATEETKINDVKMDYFYVSSSDTAEGDFGYLSGVIVKEWADMNDVPGGDNKYSFFQPLIEANDKATWYPMRNYTKSVKIQDKYNQVSECSLDFAFQDLNDMLDNFFVEEDDGNWQHTSYDRNLFVFMQQSRLVSWGYLSEINNGTLTDTNAQFETHGVQSGDKIWFFRQGLAIGNPYTVDTITDENNLDLTTYPSNNDASYLIVHPHDRVKASALGDYVFQGRWKNWTYDWSGSPKYQIQATSGLYEAVQKNVWVDSCIFYYKELDDILTGRFAYDSSFAAHLQGQPDQLISNEKPTEIIPKLEPGVTWYPAKGTPYYLGNYKGLLGQYWLDKSDDSEIRVHTTPFIRNIFDVDEEHANFKGFSKIWEPQMSLYDCIASISDVSLSQIECFTDYEFRNERVLFFRTKKNKDTVYPILHVWNGELYPGGYSVTEDDKELMQANIESGSREYVDYVKMIGAINPDTAIIIADDKPDNFRETDSIDIQKTKQTLTREVIKSNKSIIDESVCFLNAEAMQADLIRVPKEGAIITEPISIRETWFEDGYEDDDNVEDYYGRMTTSEAGYFFGDSDWFHNRIFGVATVHKDRTSQGHLYRKPFSLVGEVGEFHITYATSYRFLIFGTTLKYDDAGFQFLIEPDFDPWEVSRLQNETQRAIEYVEQKFATVDTVIQAAEMRPIHKTLVDYYHDAGVGITQDDFPIDTDNPNPGIIYVEFSPAKYQDKNGYGSAYAYAFWTSDTGDWGDWEPTPVRNLFGRTTLPFLLAGGPDIRLDTDGTNFGSNGDNWVYLDVSGTGWYTGAGQTAYVMVILCTRHVTYNYGNITFTPRGTTTVMTTVAQTMTSASPIWDGEDEKGQVIRMWGNVGMIT